MSCQTRLLRINTWIKRPEWVFGFDFCACACLPEGVLNVSKEAFTCELLINDGKWVARIDSTTFLSFLASASQFLPWALRLTGLDSERTEITWPLPRTKGVVASGAPKWQKSIPHRNVTRIEIAQIQFLLPDANHLAYLARRVLTSGMAFQVLTFYT